ncbi:MAG: membrane protein insertase YidC [Gammaproteobacteria bacterium]
MDNLRVFLWAGLALMIWMSFDAWQKQFPPEPASMTAPQEPSADAGTPVSGAADDLPTLPEAAPPPASAGEVPALPGQATGGRTPQLITVRTDVFEVRIDLLGGDVASAKLLDYPLRKDRPDVPVQLLSGDPINYFAVRTGLRAGNDMPEANHQSTFSAGQSTFRLADGADELVVPLTWTGEGDIRSRKIYRFRRGSYAIGLEQVVTNDGEQPYQAVSYLQIRRVHNPPERSMFDVDSYSFVGPVLYDGDSYEKLKADDLAEQPVALTVDGGWIASIQHHFLAAAVPQAGEPANYSANYDGNSTLISVIDKTFRTIRPGETGSFESTLFIGPKLQSQLSQINDTLTLTVDYGLLTILAQPLFWLLQKIFNIIGNWGWTIVVVTFLIKLVFYKLTEKSGRSMAKMRKLAPRLKSVQERYKDDREQLSRAMMDLYKREKVNPAAGCWPMLIQIPFFIAFYWVLLESVEMRQAPFMLWITDLSTRDPYFILPLLMGAAMFFQQKLNPPPPDPMQAKVMQFLPVMFTAMFAFFPAGLVLYWLTNSVLSMAQQWRINKVIGAD